MTIAVDTETTGLNILRGDRPFIVSTFNDLDESVRLWEWPVDPCTRAPHIPVPDLCEITKYLRGQDLVFHNAIFDLRALASVGLEFSFTHPYEAVFSYPYNYCRDNIRKSHLVECRHLHDTQLLSHAVRSEGAGGHHDLKSLAFHYLDYPNDDEEALQRAVVAARRHGKKQGWSLGTNHKGESAVNTDYWMPKACFDLLPEIDPDWETLARIYATKDVERTLGLFFFLEGLIEEDPHADDLFTSYHREVRLLNVTYRMENAGMSVDLARLEHELEHFQEKATGHKLKAELLIRKHTNTPTNIDSPQQLINWLAGAKILPRKRTAKGNYSTDADSLLECAQIAERPANGHQPYVAAVLRHLVGFDESAGDSKTEPGYRTYTSATRYLTSYQQLLQTDNDGDTRVHPSFNQSGTKFTRYSCSKPNGQNISKLAVIPLRRVFGPRDGYIWLDPDYSQLELRIFAYAAQDRSMIDAFERGYDFHEFTACKMFACEPHEVTKEQRRYAKATNFKAIYGGLNNVPPIYGEQFPTAAAFMARVTRQVEELGYITTMQGDRIYVDPDKAYVGVDAICQGTAGRIVKEAMRMLHESALVDWDGCHMVANIHDEIIFEVALDYPLVPLAKRIKEIMESAGSLAGVVTPVDFSYTLSNWAETTSLKKLSELGALTRRSPV